MKKMLRTPYYLFAGIGLACMVLQAVYFAQMDEKGLLPRGHWTSVLTLILAAAGLVLAILLRNPGKVPQYPAKVRALGGLAGMLGIGAAAVSMMLQGDWMSAVPALLGALAVGYIARCRLLRLRSHFLAYGIGAAFLMFYLISHYRLWSAESEMGRYLLRLFALVFLMLAFYQKAVLGAGQGKRPVHYVYSTVAMMLSFGAVPGADHPALFLGVGIWLLLDPTVRVRKNVTPKPKEEAPQNAPMQEENL